MASKKLKKIVLAFFSSENHKSLNSDHNYLPLCPLFFSNCFILEEFLALIESSMSSTFATINKLKIVKRFIFGNNLHSTHIFVQ